ncbi:hypothetical protein [Micromonospora tulbaghiae]|uniref:hypothetical protein n=1 Tax=Micromonospora tulbaghiae TaxID=479978 RepID=UPI0013C41DE8|nr:hypothetical protein [Micromonospora tulbaghiae]
MATPRNPADHAVHAPAITDVCSLFAVAALTGLCAGAVVVAAGRAERLARRNEPEVEAALRRINLRLIDGGRPDGL